MAHMSKTHALAALIEAVKDTNGWANPDIVDNASRRGYPMSKSNISRLSNEDVKSMGGDQVRALAAGLDLPVHQVVTAFLKSMDLPHDEGTMSVSEALSKELYPQSIRNMVLNMLAGFRQQD